MDWLLASRKGIGVAAAVLALVACDQSTGQSQDLAAGDLAAGDLAAGDARAATDLATPDAASSDGSADAGLDGAAPDALPPSVVCGTTTCDTATQICVQSTGGIGFSYTCQPIPQGCANDRTCACAGSTLCQSPYLSCGNGPGPDTLSCDCPTCA